MQTPLNRLLVARFGNAEDSHKVEVWLDSDGARAKCSEGWSFPFKLSYRGRLDEVIAEAKAHAKKMDSWSEESD